MHQRGPQSPREAQRQQGDTSILLSPCPRTLRALPPGAPAHEQQRESQGVYGWGRTLQGPHPGDGGAIRGGLEGQRPNHEDQTWEQSRGGEGWRLGLNFLANKIWVHPRRWRNGGQGPCSPPCCCCDLLIPHRQELRSGSHFVQFLWGSITKHHSAPITHTRNPPGDLTSLCPNPNSPGGPPRSAAQGAQTPGVLP